jgi:hypothetical protein
VQIDMADRLLGHAAELLAERRVTGEELHYLARRLSESLRDVARVAESRGRGSPAGPPGHDRDGVSAARCGGRTPGPRGRGRRSAWSTSGDGRGAVGSGCRAGNRRRSGARPRGR